MQIDIVKLYCNVILEKKWYKTIFLEKIVVVLLRFFVMSIDSSRLYLSSAPIQLSVLMGQSRYLCERADFGKIYDLYGVLI
jgi:hypothetical protein